MDMPDIDGLVRLRREAPDGEYDYSAHGGFIMECGSYGEYTLRCCIDGIEPIVIASEFDEIKRSFCSWFLGFTR